MTTPAVPKVECEQHRSTFVVSDVMAAVEFYTRKLGFTLGFTWGDPPTFAGVSLDRVSVHLSQGTPNARGGLVLFFVADADELFEFHRTNGVEIVQPISDRPWGLRQYTIRDLDGYMLEFAHAIFTVGEPIVIERVEVPVRLEKRLAALLADLAEHKRMTLSSCLEEILLHTCEPWGDEVASPHTARTLRYIQELKGKHGIDYDSHGSYRFVEADTLGGGT